MKQRALPVLRSGFWRYFALAFCLAYIGLFAVQHTVEMRVPSLLQSNIWLKTIARCSASWGIVVIILIALVFAVIATAVVFYDAHGATFPIALLVFLIGLIMVVAAIYALAAATTGHFLDKRGIGTIQANLDETFQQEDLALKGELGTYGGLLEDTETGAKDYYICRSVDNYGPFSFQVLVSSEVQPFADGSFEQFVYSAEDDSAYSLTMRHYDDGYWVSVKRFASAEKLGVEINSLADMEKYIIQLEFTNHSSRSSFISEASLLRELRWELDPFGVY